MRLVGVPGILKVMLSLSRATFCSVDALFGLSVIQQTSGPNIAIFPLLTARLLVQKVDLSRR